MEVPTRLQKTSSEIQFPEKRIESPSGTYGYRVYFWSFAECVNKYLEAIEKLRWDQLSTPTSPQQQLKQMTDNLNLTSETASRPSTQTYTRVYRKNIYQPQTRLLSKKPISILLMTLSYVRLDKNFNQLESIRRVRD